jgi:hypothetical protein
MTHDYIAIVLLGGGSSWARNSNPETAIKKVVNAVQNDWGQIFNMRGADIYVNVWDVTGNDEVHWDDEGMHGDKQDEHPITKVSTRLVVLPGKRKQAA